MQVEEIIDKVSMAAAWLDEVDLRGRRVDTPVHQSVTSARAALSGALEVLQEQTAEVSA